VASWDNKVSIIGTLQNILVFLFKISNYSREYAILDAAIAF